MTFTGNVQTTYDAYMPVGFPGGLADCGFKDTVTGCALENIPFGCAVVSVYGTDFGYSLPGSKNSVITITGELVEDNSIAITYNGGSIGPVVFNTSHEQTLKDVVTLLLAQPTISQAFYSIQQGVSIIEVLAAPPATSAVSVFTVTLGDSQPTTAVVQSTTNTFAGVCQYSASQGIPVQLSAVANYKPGYLTSTPMNVLRQGRIYVQPEEAVNKGDPVYMRVIAGVGEQRGAFRKSADGGDAVLISTAVWSTSAPAGGIAVLQLNP